MRQALFAAIALLVASHTVAQQPPVEVRYEGQRAVSGQAAPTPLIESEGIGEADCVPDCVEFRFCLRPSGGTLREAVETAAAFETRLNKELEARELAPSQMAVPGVSIPDVGQNAASVEARLRFGMGRFHRAENGPSLFVGLCEEMRGLAKTLECSVTGPFLALEDTEPIERKALAAAVANAYPAAEAVAQSMRAEVVAVDRVRILDVTWNGAPLPKKDPLPTLRSIICTARVRVAYVFSAT